MSEYMSNYVDDIGLRWQIRNQADVDRASQYVRTYPPGNYFRRRLVGIAREAGLKIDVAFAADLPSADGGGITENVALSLMETETGRAALVNMGFQIDSPNNEGPLATFGQTSFEIEEEERRVNKSLAMTETGLQYLKDRGILPDLT